MTPGASQVVLTNGPQADQPGIVYNLSPGQQIVISMFCFGVNTVNDDCDFEFGCTDTRNGEGAFTPCTPRFHVATGAAREGRATYDRVPATPIVLKYSNGVRCVTMRVDANDAGCEITAAYNGWFENET